MKLVIAEKPSVAGAIAKALGVTERKDGYLQGGDYLISWCIGHLVGLAAADAYDEKYKKWRYGDLPIKPEPWQLATGADKASQFKVLFDLMRDKRVSSLVCATDAGREGELIFRLVYEKAGCTKPFERLWISSMEDAAIREGFARLMPGTDYDNLYASALCRAKADWLIGINATRLFTTLYNHKLNVGRVQSPTLAMLVDRDTAINGFKKEPFYHARIDCGSFEAVSDRLKERGDAQAVKAACDGGQAVVVSVEQEQKTANPPRLYDLTTLQREANRLFGFTAKQTLDIVQSLYEKKLCTYPRTDSQFLTEDMRDTAAGVATFLMATPPFAQGDAFTPDVGRVINNTKVSDHHAIIPTAQLAKADYAALPDNEKSILLMVGVRLLCATAAPHQFETVKAVLGSDGHLFSAKGKTVTQAGWKAIEQGFKASVKPKDSKHKGDDAETDAALPPLAEGQHFDNVAASVTEHTTTPPKPYTEDTLLSAMETAGNDEVELSEDAEKKGLGTPATRAGIIEKLVSSGFAERKGKQLIPTKDGVNLITILPERVKSPALTAEWENALTLIAKGQLSPDDFMRDIEAKTDELVRQYSVVSEEHKGLFAGPERESIGVCPRCGGGVAEGKKNFYCQNRECSFAMWKDDKFFSGKKKTLTKSMAAALLKDGRVAVKGLFSEKSGKTYDATVLLADTGVKYVNYRLEFAEKGARK